MLYKQNSELVKSIFETVKNFEKINKCKVIFISTIGSHSKEIGREDSDYDLRCLYVKNNFEFLERKYIHDEKKIRFRIFNDKSLCNCIPFWEISAFLNFLYEPYINNGYKYKLIKNVFWTFKSQYTFDPHGLQKQLLPLIERQFSPLDEFNYVLNETNHFFELINKKEFNKRNLLESIYGVIYLEWMISNKRLPPISIYQLLETKGIKENQILFDFIDRIKLSNSNNIKNKVLKIDIKDYVSAKLNYLCKLKIDKDFFSQKDSEKCSLDVLLKKIRKSFEKNL